MPITIRFTSRDQGSVSWQGKTFPIQRFNFSLGGSVPQLKGEWAVMLVYPATTGRFYGDRFMIDGAVEGSAGAGGHRFGLSTKSVDNLIIIENSPNKYAQGYNYFGVVFNGAGAWPKYFIFNFAGLNRIVGLMQFEDSSLSSEEAWADVAKNGVQFEGYRIVR
jgi:hypothetical protein